MTNPTEPIKEQTPSSVPGKENEAIQNPLNTEGGIESLAEKQSRTTVFLSALGTNEVTARWFLGGVIASVFVVALFSYFLLPPADFPTDKIVSIKKSVPLSSTAKDLKEKNFIRSTTMFRLCVLVTGGDKKIGAGDYLFKEPLGACALSFRLTKSITGIPSFRATIPEGMTNKEIAALLEPSLPKFDVNFFVDHARAAEGYLFPDTYFFELNQDALDIENTMRENFARKVEPLSGAVAASKHSLREVVIMASILEKEARTPEDMALVSGILWKRIARGMPLQVDAPFLYLLGKASNELTDTDLNMNSAYNTYKNKGLPAGPIGNPGLNALQAAITPEGSPYFYYLSDKNGNIHYARTFDEHKANKVKYLR